MAAKKKKGETVTLYCESCSWSTDLPMSDTASSTSLPCAHCGQTLYWHHCERCDLGYAGNSQPRCPICDDDSLDDVQFSS